MITFTAGVCSSNNAGPSLDSAKLIGIIGNLCFLTQVTQVSLSQGTKFNNPLNGKVIGSQSMLAKLSLLPLVHWSMGFVVLIEVC